MHALDMEFICDLRAGIIPRIFTCLLRSFELTASEDILFNNYHRRLRFE